MTNKERAMRMQELMSKGVSLEEALAEVTKKIVQPRVEDRETWISELGSISELRKAIKIAFAKKSKTKSGSGKLETIEKYQKEIEAGQARLRELVAQITDWESAKALGEEPKGYSNIYLERSEEEVNKRIELLEGTKKEIKERIKKQPETMSDTVPEEIKVILEGRLKNRDMRVITWIKKMNLLESSSN